MTEDDTADKMMSHLQQKLDAYNHLASIEVDDLHKSNLMFTAGEFKGLREEFVQIRLDTILKEEKADVNRVR